MRAKGLAVPRGQFQSLDSLSYRGIAFIDRQKDSRSSQQAIEGESAPKSHDNDNVKLNLVRTFHFPFPLQWCVWHKTGIRQGFALIMDSNGL